MRTIIRLLIRLGLAAAIGFAIRKVLLARRSDQSVDSSTPWPPLEDRASRPSGATSTTASGRSVTMERAEATTTRSGMATTKKAAKKTAAKKSTKKAPARKAPAKKTAAKKSAKKASKATKKRR